MNAGSAEVRRRGLNTEMRKKKKIGRRSEYALTAPERSSHLLEISLAVAKNQRRREKDLPPPEVTNQGSPSVQRPELFNKWRRPFT